MKRISILLAFVISASMFIVSCNGGEKATPETTDEAVTEETTPAVEETPVAEETAVAEEEATVADEATTDLANGEAIYKQSCSACHDNAVAGAAKLDDKARWEATAAKGLEQINKNAIEGFTGENGVMPAKGGATITDQETMDAVAYMLSTAGVTAE